jgi:hypothetical protein
MGELYSSRSTPSGKSSRYTLDRRLDGPQGQSRLCEEKENFLLLPGIEPRFLHFPAVILIATGTLQV